MNSGATNGLGKPGPRDTNLTSIKVEPQEWDALLAAQLGISYNNDLGEWPSSGDIHSSYWTNIPFLDDVISKIDKS